MIPFSCKHHYFADPVFSTFHPEVGGLSTVQVDYNTYHTFGSDAAQMHCFVWCYVVDEATVYYEDVFSMLKSATFQLPLTATRLRPLHHNRPCLPDHAPRAVVL